MDWLWINDNFLGIHWHFWKVLGWMGNGAFFVRFVIQWYASERKGRVIIPAAFWWLSLTGSLLLLMYALFYKKDSVFIFAHAFTWIPYFRNLVLHRRETRAQVSCEECPGRCPPGSKYCPHCGASLIKTGTES